MGKVCNTFFFCIFYLKIWRFDEIPNVFCISFPLVWAHSLGAQTGMWASELCGSATGNPPLKILAFQKLD